MENDLKINELKPEIKNDPLPENKTYYFNMNNNQNQEPISTEILQKILYLYSLSKNSGEKIENNISKSLTSIKYNLFESFTENDELDNDSESHLNPFIKVKEKINKISKLNIKTKQNMSNSELKEKIKSYYELKNKILNYKKNNIDISNKLYIVNHPLVSLFENNIINIKELKNDIQKDFNNKMLNNTNQKYIIAPPLNENDNNIEDNDGSLNSLHLVINSVGSEESDDNSHFSGSENDLSMGDHSNNDVQAQNVENNHENSSDEENTEDEDINNNSNED